MEKTRSIKATIGMFDNEDLAKMTTAEKSEVNIDDFNWCLQRVQKEVYEKYGLYVAFQTSIVDCVYHAEWGCPSIGEPCALMTAIANPKFINDLDKWQEAALEIITKMKELASQSTVTVEIYDSNIIYLE